MIFEQIFRRVEEVPTGVVGEARVVGALNMLASSGETRVEVIDLLDMSPKTWGEKCRGRGWGWSQKTRNGSTHYYIEVK